MLKGTVGMKIEDFERQAGEALVKCLTEVPFVEILDTTTITLWESGQPNLLARLKIDDKEQVLIAEIKNNGQPRYARQAVNQILRYLENYPDAYGVFLAPYISPQSEAICREANVGFVDLAGNCYISFRDIYIRKTGNPNPNTQKRDLRSLYSPKAERILRVMLAAPLKAWKMEELAEEASVSLGHVANVKKLLSDRLWIEDFSIGFSLKEPEVLLEEWSENYRFRRNGVFFFYSLDRPADFEFRLGETCEQRGIRYGLTSFSGAARLAPMVRYQRATAYIGGERAGLVDMLDLKPVTSGANVTLLEPYDEGVFYGKNEIDGLQVIHPVQIYLDLKATRGRGDEAAESLLSEVIRKGW